MKIDKVIKRIKYLKTEIAHEGYWDGWALEGMRDELSELETKLYFHTRNNKIEESLKNNE
jgi:hypothetical protein|tara:strand:- start:525 stop:704 length:180 start_codon:yes stop_codon:yes gene_type:complete